MKPIPLTLDHLDELIKIQQVTYPKELQEDKETLTKLLTNGRYNVGMQNDEESLIACVLCDHSNISKHELWLWDISVIPTEQRKGYSKQLLNYFFSLLRGKNITVSLWCRDTSHRLFTDPNNLHKWGYVLKKDTFLKDAFFETCGLHEDAYEIELHPVK